MSREAPDKRYTYASAAALAEDLTRLLDNRPIVARPVGVLGQLRRWSNEIPSHATAITVAIGIFWVAFRARVVELSASGRCAPQGRKATRAADLATIKANDNAKAERWSRYRANISSSGSALLYHNVGAARRFLEDAPEEHRGWEWRHFHNQLDDARLVLTGHSGQVNQVIFSPDAP